MVVYVIAELFHEHFLRCQLDGKKHILCRKLQEYLCTCNCIFFYGKNKLFNESNAI